MYDDPLSGRAFRITASLTPSPRWRASALAPGREPVMVRRQPGPSVPLRGRPTDGPLTPRASRNASSVRLVATWPPWPIRASWSPPPWGGDTGGPPGSKTFCHAPGASSKGSRGSWSAAKVRPSIRSVSGTPSGPSTRSCTHSGSGMPARSSTTSPRTREPMFEYAYSVPGACCSGWPRIRRTVASRPGGLGIPMSPATRTSRQVRSPAMSRSQPPR